MRSLLNLFGRSPFAPIQSHMECVGTCVQELPPLLTALEAGDEGKIAAIAARIDELERAADVTQHEICRQLPGSLFFSIDRSTCLRILQLQDAMADAVQDAAVLISLRRLPISPSLHVPLRAFAAKNLEVFDGARRIVQEFPDLLESSFGGTEAERVRGLIDEVAFMEHEADMLQRDLLRHLYDIEHTIGYGVFYQWQRIFEAIGRLANLAEQLAECVRMTLTGGES